MQWTVLLQDPKKIEKTVDRLRPSTKVAFKKAIEDMETEGPTHPKDGEQSLCREVFRAK